MSTVRMQAPAGVSQVVGSQGSPPGSGTAYTVDAQGFVNVDQRDVASLLAAGFSFAQGLTATSVNISPRNLLDGGDFTSNPWQKGTTFNNVGTSAILTADRWCAIAGTSVVMNVSKASNVQVPGFSAAYRFGRSVGDTHSTGMTVGQVLETLDAIRIQGLPVALSFWADSGSGFAGGTSSNSFAAVLTSGVGSVDDTFANLVTAGWTATANIISATINPTTAATRFGPFYGTVPAGCTQLALQFLYSPSAGTTAAANEYIELMGVQLEPGGMTNFEHLDVAYVLEQCQRYLVVLNEGTTGTISGAGTAFTTTTAEIYMALPAPMRKQPTVTITVGGFSVTNGAGTAVAVSGAGSAATLHTPQAIGLLATVASGLTIGQGTFLVGRTTASGSIVCDADYA